MSVLIRASSAASRCGCLFLASSLARSSSFGVAAAAEATTASVAPVVFETLAAPEEESTAFVDELELSAFRAVNAAVVPPVAPPVACFEAEEELELEEELLDEVRFERREHRFSSTDLCVAAPNPLELQLPPITNR